MRLEHGRTTNHREKIMLTVAHTLINIVAATTFDQVCIELEHLKILSQPKSENMNSSSNHRFVASSTTEVGDRGNDHEIFFECFYELHGSIVIIGIMRRYRTHHIIQMRSCVLLSNVGILHDNFCKLAIRMGAIQIILHNVLIDFDNDVITKYAACHCLIIFSRHLNYQTIIEQLKDPLHAMKLIIVSIVSFMKIISKDTVTTRQVCYTLQNLCQFDNCFNSNIYIIMVVLLFHQMHYYYIQMIVSNKKLQRIQYVY